MTPEQRLDRLERIAKLFVRAGLMTSTNIRKQHDTIRDHRESLREQNEKINILINMQIENEARSAKNEERFARNEERFARNEERFARNEERFSRTERALERLIALQSRTDEQVQALIDTLRRTDLGGSFA
jgi:predicted nuclease with TOPRIM domain